jgi:hypothetical protein
MDRKKNVSLAWRFLVPLLALPATLDASAETTKSPEEVRAAFLLNMHRYVSVGSPSRSARQFCYYEKRDTPFDESAGQMLERYVAEQMPGQLPPVRRYQAIRDLKGCDVFFIPAGEDAEVDNILAALGTEPTVTVSSAKRFIYRGGMIGFVMEEGRVAMEGDLTNMSKRDVHVDPQLLEVMVRVNGNRAPKTGH